MAFGYAVTSVNGDQFGKIKLIADTYILPFSANFAIDFEIIITKKIVGIIEGI